MGQFLHHRNILLSQQVVGRICGLAYGLCDEFNGLCFSLSLADTCRSLTLGMQDFLLLHSLSAVDSGSFLTFRLQNLRLFVTL